MPQSKDPTPRDAQLAAELDAGGGAQHLATVYARALLGAAQNAGQTEAVLDEFDSLLAEVLDKFPRLEAVLDSWLVSYEERSGILERVLAGKVSPLVLNFLKVVSRHGRFDHLRAIHHQAHLLYDQMQGRIHVQLTTATPVEETLLRRISENLRDLIGGEPVLQQITDPDLIGGAVVRLGDTVYDGSVANQLEILRQQMIDRSVHEIQSRRDRFRYPAGN